MTAIIAIIGRPNVGKSTLFNRLIGRRQALVQDQPGVTRDRLYGTCSWRGREWIVVDTGGIVAQGNALEEKVSAQSAVACAEADAVICVFDGREAPTPDDIAVVEQLRRANLPIIYAVNKLDNDDEIGELHDLGVSPLIPISAEHGIGIDAVLDQLFDVLPAPIVEVADNEDYASSPPGRTSGGDGEAPPALPVEGATQAPDDEEISARKQEYVRGPLKVALVGRPNVGKSTLVNQLAGAERVVAHDMPGTTRDVIDVLIQRDGDEIILLDTAGIRRKSKTHEALEKFSIIKSLRTLERADVVVGVIDAQEGLTHQDRSLLMEAYNRGRPVVVLINKWDAMTTGTPSDYIDGARHMLGEIGRVPIVCGSALRGTGIDILWQWIVRSGAAVNQRIGTSELNRLLEEAQRGHHLPSHRGHHVRLYYATQTGVRPPTITCFSNFPDNIPDSYQRYLKNQLETWFGVEGLPIRIRFQKK